MPPARSASRSWRVHRLGRPREALTLDEGRPREPGSGEVRVSVTAVGLNFPDLLLCAGTYQERPVLPFSPGYEAAGTVVEAGTGSVHRKGESVIVVPELPNGAMQESLTVPDAQVYPVPPEVPVTTAAVLNIASTTAHLALHRRASLRAGETVLVSGAAGGVGSAVVQLAKAADARVVALATGRDHAEACTTLGADVAINLAVLDEGDDELVAQVRAATDGHGADVVIDVVGGDLFDRLRRCVAFEGRLVTAGFTSGSVPAVRVNHVLLRSYAVVGVHLAAYRTKDPALLQRIHNELVDLVLDGRLAPTIHRELPFERAPEGLAMLAAREVIGRVVLRR